MPRSSSSSARRGRGLSVLRPRFLVLLAAAAAAAALGPGGASAATAATPAATADTMPTENTVPKAVAGEEEEEGTEDLPKPEQDDGANAAAATQQGDGILSESGGGEIEKKSSEINLGKEFRAALVPWAKATAVAASKLAPLLLLAAKKALLFVVLDLGMLLIFYKKESGIGRGSSTRLSYSILLFSLTFREHSTPPTFPPVWLGSVFASLLSLWSLLSPAVCVLRVGAAAAIVAALFVFFFVVNFGMAVFLANRIFDIARAITCKF